MSKKSARNKNRAPRNKNRTPTKAAAMVYVGGTWEQISKEAEKLGVRFDEFTDQLNAFVQSQIQPSFSGVIGGFEIGGLMFHVDVTDLGPQALLMLVSVVDKEVVA